MSPIIDKIRKLQAMVERGTEAEAIIASEKILEILAKYNLDPHDISAVEANKVEVEGESFIEKYNEQWRRTIIIATAKLYFCKGFYQSWSIPGTVSGRMQSAAKYTFIGRPHNRAIAIDMARHLVATVNRLANEGARATIPGATSTERGRYVNTFRLACSIRLRERINLMIEQAKKGLLRGTDGQNLPALNDLYTTEYTLAERWLLGMNIKLTQTKSRAGYLDATGIKHGQEAGGRISLQPQVGMGNRNLMIGSGTKH